MTSKGEDSGAVLKSRPQRGGLSSLRTSIPHSRVYDIIPTWGAKSKATPMDAVHRGRLLFMTYGTQSSTARRTLQNRCCEIAREHCAAASDLGGCGCTLARCASRTKAR